MTVFAGKRAAPAGRNGGGKEENRPGRSVRLLEARLNDNGNNSYLQLFLNNFRQWHEQAALAQARAAKTG